MFSSGLTAGCGGSQPAPSTPDGATIIMNALALYALDAKTGDFRWNTTLNSYEDSLSPLSNPTVVDGVIYCGGKRNKAYKAVTGDPLWESQLHEWCWSPTVVDGIAFFTTDENTMDDKTTIHAFDANTGSIEWESHVEDGSLSTPHVVDSVYLSSSDTIYALDLKSGTEEWKYSYTRQGNRISNRPSSPTLFKGVVYVGTENDVVLALDAESGDLRWQNENVEGKTATSPAIVGQTMYIGSFRGNFYALDANTGEIKWSFDAGSKRVTQFTISDGRAYVANALQLHALDAISGKKLWEFKMSPRRTEDYFSSEPTVWKDYVYLASTNGLRAIDTRSGELQWVMYPDHPEAPDQTVMTSPTVVVDPESGDSVDSRVMNGTDGHHNAWADKASKT
jgi:outer membrane protein assembly factor BamB